MRYPTIVKTFHHWFKKESFRNSIYAYLPRSGRYTQDELRQAILAAIEHRVVIEEDTCDDGLAYDIIQSTLLNLSASVWFELLKEFETTGVTS